jgi:hypothetical protein
MAEEVKNTTAEPKKEKKSLMVWMAEHPKTTFAARAFTWAAFAAILPFMFIAFRYGIFKNQGTIAISGWGIIAVVIVAVFLIGLLGYLKQGMREGMAKQCIVGFCKIVVPLLMVLAVVQGIRSNIDLFVKALGVTIACEIVAIPINPFPAWLEERRKEKNLEERESLFGALWDKFFAKKKEYENGE